MKYVNIHIFSQLTWLSQTDCGWWRKTTYTFEFSVKSSIRIRYFSSCAKKKLNFVDQCSVWWNILYICICFHYIGEISSWLLHHSALSRLWRFSTVDHSEMAVSLWWPPCIFDYLITQISVNTTYKSTIIFIVYSCMFQLTWVIFRLELYLFAMSLCLFWDPRRLDVFYFITIVGCNVIVWYWCWLFLYVMLWLRVHKGYGQISVHQ